MTHPDIPSSHGLIERGLGNGHAFWTIAMVGAVLVLQSSVTALVLSPEPLSLDAEPTRASQAMASATTSENVAQSLKTASTLKTSAGAQSSSAKSMSAESASAQSMSADSANTESLSTKALSAESISTQSESTRPEGASASDASTLKMADQGPAAVASTTLPADAAANAATGAVAVETSRHDESGNAVAQSSANASETSPDSAEKPVKVAATTATTTEASGSAKPVQPVAAAEALPTPRAKPAHLVRKAPAKAAVVKASRKAKPQAIAKSTGVRPTDRQLRRLPGDYLTLQLISLKDDAHLDAFVERFGQQTEQARIKVKKPDGIRHVLVHGTFASRGDADRVAGQIFKRFGIKPWVRRIEDLRQELSTGA